MNEALAPFVGVPDLARGRTAAGADCWGLAMLVYRGLLGIDLPDYASEYGDDRDHSEIGAIISREKQRWAKVETPKLYDLIGFQVGRHDSHVGIWLAPGRMLHMVKADCSKIGRYDHAPWAGRLFGFYRWDGNAWR